MITEVNTSDFYIDYIKFYCFTDEALDNNVEISKERGRCLVAKKHIHPDSPYYISRPKYGEVISAINSEIMNLVIDKGFKFKMPSRMGTIEIRKKKSVTYIDDNGNFINNLPVDWGATNKLWKEDSDAAEKKKLIRHTNPHTRGYVARFYLDKGAANFKNKRIYKFSPCREAQRDLAKAIHDNPQLDFYTF
jgi:hypothetical protein